MSDRAMRMPTHDYIAKSHARAINNMYKALIAEGFGREQAWEMSLNLFKGALA